MLSHKFMKSNPVHGMFCYSYTLLTNLSFSFFSFNFANNLLKLFLLYIILVLCYLYMYMIWWMGTVLVDLSFIVLLRFLMKCQRPRASLFFVKPKVINLIKSGLKLVKKQAVWYIKCLSKHNDLYLLFQLCAEIRLQL